MVLLGATSVGGSASPGGSKRRPKIPFRRMESLPGDEMQVDFGQGAWVVEPDGRKRRPHLFRAVLSHSRKGYTEVVWRQDTESFLRCIENAFRAIGGVTRTVGGRQPEGRGPAGGLV